MRLYKGSTGYRPKGTLAHYVLSEAPSDPVALCRHVVSDTDGDKGWIDVFTGPTGLEWDGDCPGMTTDTLTVYGIRCLTDYMTSEQ